MSTINTLTLFITILTIALIPGPAIALVMSRTLSNGFKAGLITCAGIVCGDYVFILLAIFGLSALTQLMGDFFLIVKYLGALYLIFLGYQLLKSKHSQPPEITQNHSRSFITGLITTLSNPKALLFYAGLLPNIINPASITFLDAIIITLTITVAVLIAMIGTVLITLKTKSFIKSQTKQIFINKLTGSILVGEGVYIAARQ